jgi:hypothetical protein
MRTCSILLITSRTTTTEYKKNEEEIVSRHTCGSPGTTRMQSLHPWMRSWMISGLTLSATCTACVASLSIEVFRDPESSDDPESWLLPLSIVSHILRKDSEMCRSLRRSSVESGWDSRIEVPFQCCRHSTHRPVSQDQVHTVIDKRAIETLNASSYL